MNAIGAAILLPVLLVTLGASSRRVAVLALMAGVLFLTQGQSIQLAGLTVFPTRFMEIAGFIRVMSRGELSLAKLNRVDKTLLTLYIYTTVIFVVRSSESQIYQIGNAIDVILTYFTFRGLIKGIDDLRWILRALPIVLAPYVVLVMMESVKGKTMFASMGGFSYYEWERGGRTRCEGSFRNPSLLGSLGASFLPLYIGLLCSKAKRKLAWLGLALCLAIIWASNSGGPANFALFGLLGWALWGMRRKMQWVRRGLALMITALGVVMKAPVWFLLERASDLSGGDGYHRAELIDRAMNSITKWVPIGMPISETRNWFPYLLAANGAADITNQFVDFGLTGGVLSIVLFIVLLSVTFSNLGRGMAVVRSGAGDQRESEFLLWGLGVLLAGHIVNWLGITYFDQSYVVWLMQLAAMVNLSEEAIARGTSPDPANSNPLGQSGEAETLPSHTEGLSSGPGAFGFEACAR